MCLTYGQRRAPRKLKRAIRVSDPRLAARLDMFGRLNRDEDMPGIEQSVIPGGDRRESSRRRFPQLRGYLKPSPSMPTRATRLMTGAQDSPAYPALTSRSPTVLSSHPAPMPISSHPAGCPGLLTTTTEPTAG